MWTGQPAPARSPQAAPLPPTTRRAVDLAITVKGQLDGPSSTRDGPRRTKVHETLLALRTRLFLPYFST